MASDKRFVWVDRETGGFLKEAIVIVDSQTGVNYLLVSYGNTGGLTPLLDENGRPIVTKRIIND
ncbi:MAG: hypothetical protein IKQ89_08515 [Muribaculaceae bacterium]|nr:hypothetical protein [Muribaculaceae bacterium]